MINNSSDNWQNLDLFRLKIIDKITKNKNNKKKSS
jgi:hypothetical protein